MTGDLRRISIVLFDGFELLDVFGPVELFSMVPDRLAVEFVGPEAGPVASSQGAEVIATSRYDAAATPDIMLIPGGQGARRLVEDEAFLSWLRDLGNTRVSGDLGVHGVCGPGGSRLARRLPGDLEQGRLCLGAYAESEGRVDRSGTLGAGP